MAEGTNNSAAAMVAASSPMKIETISLPGFGGGTLEDSFDPKNYKVRYGKYDLDNPEHVCELEGIETEGLLGVEIVVLNKQSFTFMNQFFLIVTYLEKIGATS